MKTLSIPYFTSFLFLSAISAVRGNPVIATLAAVETKKPCTTTLTIPPTFYTRPITTTYIDSIVVTETKTVNCNGCVLTTVNGRNPGGPIQPIPTSTFLAPFSVSTVYECFSATFVPKA